MTNCKVNQDQDFSSSGAEDGDRCEEEMRMVDPFHKDLTVKLMIRQLCEEGHSFSVGPTYRIQGVYSSVGKGAHGV